MTTPEDEILTVEILIRRGRLRGGTAPATLLVRLVGLAMEPLRWGKADYSIISADGQALEGFTYSPIIRPITRSEDPQ